MPYLRATHGKPFGGQLGAAGGQWAASLYGNRTALPAHVLIKWAHLGSNQGPTGYEPVALPTELWAHKQTASGEA